MSLRVIIAPPAVPLLLSKRLHLDYKRKVRGKSFVLLTNEDFGLCFHVRNRDSSLELQNNTSYTGDVPLRQHFFLSLKREAFPNACGPH